MSIWLALSGLSLLTVVYVYVGYPLLVTALVRLRGARPIRQGDECPPVTLIISAYNEAEVIGQKIENSLALDYPPDRLSVLVCSDASTDGTDDIVRSYAARGVTLWRQPERLGKTAGLNEVVPRAAGEIVVFSDANAMYDRQALRKLVRNFADPRVGCVTGHARYMEEGHAAADNSERAYWSYETRLKRAESALGSMVGGDGAIYAIRKGLWQRLPDTAINDFLNPLQIVAAGSRAVFEPEAFCFERTVGRVGLEYRRRVRIVSRSWRAVFQAPGVLNPFRVGLFTLSLISHKILRWFTLPLLLAAAPAALVAARAGGADARIVLAGCAAFGVALLVPQVRRVAASGLYFLVISYASLVGLVKGTFGHVSGIWTTPRESSVRLLRGRWMNTFLPVAAFALFYAGGLVAMAVTRATGPATALFWLAAALLGYLGIGYPAALSILRLLTRRPPRRAPREPSVCLFVAAHNECAVIEAKLRNALAIDYPRDRLSIVVASDGSTDDTEAIVRRYAPQGIRLIAAAERRGKMAAINRGVPTVDSEIVVLSDANVLIQPDAIRMLVRNFADPEVGAVSGRVVLVGDRAGLGASEDLYYRYERWLQTAESEIGSMVGVDGALYAIRRPLFVPPPDDTILDDMAIPMTVVQAGYRVVYEPDALAQEQGSRTAREEFSRKARIVAGAIQFLSNTRLSAVRHNPQVAFALLSHKVLRWLSPLVVGLLIAASFTLADDSSIYFWFAVLQMMALLLGLVGCAPWLRRIKPIGFAHYLCVVHAAAAVGFLRGLGGWRPTTWRRFARAPLELR